MQTLEEDSFKEERCREKKKRRERDSFITDQEKDKIRIIKEERSSNRKDIG